MSVCVCVWNERRHTVFVWFK